LSLTQKLGKRGRFAKVSYSAVLLFCCACFFIAGCAGFNKWKVLQKADNVPSCFELNS